MTAPGKKLARTAEINSKVSRVLQARTRFAQEHFLERTAKATRDFVSKATENPVEPWEAWRASRNYWMDWAQRTVLFWDTMRQRGNQFLEHWRAGNPPVLAFKYETVIDARKFDRPVNYALVRILPPQGVKIDPKRRPYIIIDPRAGHGPGIGGFKDDSQVGVALRGGHPVYFVIFFREPEPGQTMLDVTAAEQKFVRKVRELHPNSPKPVLIGNCQGGWAAMMLAGSDPEDTGPIVINGAPMSYWGGAWKEGEGDNPMRYAAGLLGGTWLASFTSDLCNGIFDGAWLALNFENLNPANSLWDKYYHVFANVDTEPPRFLQFERWWGAYSLMNREEIEWITQNLFVGNELWSGKFRSKQNGGQADGLSFDLRDIRSPIVLFASMGDNITPPQQAFNWVADVYGSTDEIKARGQVIVGLLHQDIGHLGIFVSGRVAKKEHAQMVSVLESIEALRPGLYGMQIKERKRNDGKPEYEVEFVERRLEDVTNRLNRFKRADEKPFQAVEEIAVFNQRAYELFARPFVQAMANEPVARMSRLFHPLRAAQWAISDLNPWLVWLSPAAQVIKSNRMALGPDTLPRDFGRMLSEHISAALDAYREVRDASSEALFFEIYGNLFTRYFADQRPAEEGQKPVDPRDLPIVKTALASISKGGYPEAVARVFSLLARPDAPFSLEQLRLKSELAGKFTNLLPHLPRDQQRRIRGEQDIIVRYEPARALETLPMLLGKAPDRARLRTLLDRLFADQRVAQFKPTAEQLAMLKQIRHLLGPQGPPPRRRSRAPARATRRRGATVSARRRTTLVIPRRRAMRPRSARARQGA
jgi:pimeloyl-ACP methyl ester carboxylesterase